MYGKILKKIKAESLLLTKHSFTRDDEKYNQIFLSHRCKRNFMLAENISYTMTEL